MSKAIKWFFAVSIETWVSVALLLAVVAAWLYWGTSGAPSVQALIQREFEASAAHATVKKEPTSSALAGQRAALAPAQQVSSAPASEVSDYFARLGQTGDLFGGINALFAAVAMVAVFWAGALQRRALLEARRSAQRQHFETVFFELLKLTREIIDRIEYMPKGSGRVEQSSERLRVGYSALNYLAFRYFGHRCAPSSSMSEAERAQWLVDQYKTKVFAKLPSALGPYYRMLFQTFDQVARAPLDEVDRIRFANVARAQMSEGAVLLLALNGLTWRGRRFVKYIEHFGLLEHMHPMYRRLYEQPLRLAYRSHAFMGSEARAQTKLGDPPEPGPGAFDRNPNGADFVITQSFEEADE